MKHYLMLPQDTIRVLPPEDGQEACVELFCERVAIYFPVETLTVRISRACLWTRRARMR